MVNAVWRGFRRVADFSGRDGRGEFWPYALFVFALLMAAGAVTFLPTFADTLGRMQRFAAENPDQAQVVSQPGSYSITISGAHPGLLPDFGPVMHRMGAEMAIAVLLWAAAVARRLRDVGRTPLWGLLPLPFLGFCLLEMPSMFNDISMADSIPPLFFPVFLADAAYLVSLLWLISLLIRPGRNDPLTLTAGQ